MSVAELQELDEVKALVAKGQQVGVLTFTEIATATAELGLDEADVDELHGMFEKSQIELVEEIDPATAANVNIERAPEKRTRREAPLDLKPEGTTDARDRPASPHTTSYELPRNDVTQPDIEARGPTQTPETTAVLPHRSS